MGEDRTGVVVAGGRSTRMGERDKTVIEVAGVPMIRRVADRLLEATDHLLVNCRIDQRPAIADALAGLDPTFAIDDEPDRGPVYGIATGLGAVDTEYAAVVAADLPLLDAGLLELCFQQAVGHDAAVPRPGEWFEPLHAVYRAKPMAEACQTALTDGDTRIVDPLFSLDFVVLERSDLLECGTLDSFESVDTPTDLRWVTERLNS